MPRFATDRAARTRPLWRARPFVITRAEGGRLLVTAANARAESSGITPGMPLADAQALVPGLLTLPAEPVEDSRALMLLAEWCGRYTPWVASDGADGLFLEIAGCGHLFGGEDALARDLLERMARFGLAARVAVADTPGAAWALARFGVANPTLLGDGSCEEAMLAAALGPLPASALRLSAAHVEELRRLGLRRIADIAALPRAALTTRFGAGVARRLDQAFGRDFEPLSPHQPAAPDRVRSTFAEPVRARDAIEAVLDDLLGRLCARLAERGHGARRLDFALYRTDGTVATASVGTSRPSTDARHLARLFAEKLDHLDPGFGADVIALSAPLTEAFAAVQTTHIKDSNAAHGGLDALAPLIDRLDNRLGAGAVARLAPVDSHLPERAVARCPPLAATARHPVPWPARGLRPVRLFDPPEPVDAVAPVPDDPPVMFRWRNVLHRVARADGPERIAPEWWRTLAARNTSKTAPGLFPDSSSDSPDNARDPPRVTAVSEGAATRDYYRVEDTEGRRFWLYRHGLYRPGAAPGWFLHGLFG